MVCLDGDGCKIRSGAVTVETDSSFDTSIACDSCDTWYARASLWDWSLHYMCNTGCSESHCYYRGRSSNLPVQSIEWK